MNTMTAPLKTSMVLQFCHFDVHYLFCSEISETVETEKTEKEPKKKVWQDKKERWTHDRFNDSDQAPKSRTELIATYGYDIRNEDGPPRARRRRRYGFVFNFKLI